MLDVKELKRLKVIVFDLDGTLLNDQAEIGTESTRLVKLLQEKGVIFTFASGRLHSALTMYADELGIKAPIISMDGAYIKDYPNGNVISETYMPRKKVQKVIDYAERYLVKFAICQPEAIYYTEHNAVVPDLMDKFGAKFEEVDVYDHLLDNTLEMLLISDMRGHLKYIKKMMTFPYTWGLLTSYSKSLSNEGLYYLEIKRKGSTKASGLHRLVKHLKISIRETAVIGDWYNDLSLFETNAVKVALENAVGDLKDKADLITKRDNNADGVAEFLEEVLKAKS